MRGERMRVTPGHVDEHLDIAQRLDDVEFLLWAVLAVAGGGFLLAVVAIILALI